MKMLGFQGGYLGCIGKEFLWFQGLLSIEIILENRNLRSVILGKNHRT